MLVVAADADRGVCGRLPPDEEPATSPPVPLMDMLRGLVAEDAAPGAPGKPGVLGVPDGMFGKGQAVEWMGAPTWRMEQASGRAAVRSGNLTALDVLSWSSDVH